MKFQSRVCQIFSHSPSHDTVENYYQTTFAMMQHHKYSLTELENMIPWEREIYIGLLTKFMKEEKERNDQAERQQKQRK